MQEIRPISEFRVENLNVKIFEKRTEMGKSGADDVAKAILAKLKEKDELRMIFAAAPSQNDFLNFFTQHKEIPWEKIVAFHMDEYLGLSPDAPQCFGNYLREHIFDKVNFKQVNFLNPVPENADEECQRYEKLLREKPIDIVCLGIGENGHIAFNDPPVADFADEKWVKVVELETVCRQQQVNDGAFATIDDVPKTAMTLTIPALFSAEALFCFVPGPRKAEAVFRTLNGEIDTSCPATILRKHENAILYLDADAASRAKS